MGRKYTPSDIGRAIDTCEPTITAIARHMDCATSTVYSYFKRYPELQAKFETRKGVAIQSNTQNDEDTILRAVAGSHGVKATVARRLGVTWETVNNYCKRYPRVAQALEIERTVLLEIGVGGLVTHATDFDSKYNWQAVKYILDTQGRKEGFGDRIEVTGADGDNLLALPPELVQLMDMLGTDLQSLTNKLRMMAQAKLAQTGGVVDGT